MTYIVNSGPGLILDMVVSTNKVSMNKVSMDKVCMDKVK